MGAAARWNDLQHIYPRELDKDQILADTEQVKGKRRPTLLISPKRSFAGILWYNKFLDLMERLTKTEGFENMAGSASITPLTWHSFRVMITDATFQPGIANNQRQYLGNWMTEPTANVYTRQNRSVVVRIWDAWPQQWDSLSWKKTILSARWDQW